MRANRALGSLGFLLLSFISAGPCSGTPVGTLLPSVSSPDPKTGTSPGSEPKGEPELLLARVESRRFRRIDPAVREGPDTDLKPSADPGLQFEGEIELVMEWLNNVDLGQRPRDNLRFSSQELQLGLSYRRDPFLGFGEVNLIAEQVAFDDDRSNETEESLERGEMWLLFDSVFDSDYSVQIGRQNFIEPRLWWWDEDLDAARVYYTRAPWRLYVGLAEELSRVSTSEDFIDRRDNEVQRLLGHVGWSSSAKFDLSGYLLAQRDDSGTPNVGSVIKSEREDESDADVVWGGLRAAGAFDLWRGGRLAYRGDVAFVAGNENLVEFEDDVPGFSRVAAVQKLDVRGWALDLGTAWTLPVRGGPMLELVYGFGSGDDDLTDSTDRSFRQTGLQDQDDEFREYGVVLRPELSNLHIGTLALRLPVHTGTHLTLGYHRFWQVDAAPFLRDTAIEAEPTGESKDVGDEFSFVLQVRKWEDVELDVFAGSFKAGRAYGAGNGKRSHRLYLKLIYEF